MRFDWTREMYAINSAGFPRLFLRHPGITGYLFSKSCLFPVKPVMGLSECDVLYAITQFSLRMRKFHSELPFSSRWHIRMAVSQSVDRSSPATSVNGGQASERGECERHSHYRRYTVRTQLARMSNARNDYRMEDKSETAKMAGTKRRPTFRHGGNDALLALEAYGCLFKSRN